MALDNDDGMKSELERLRAENEILKQIYEKLKALNKEYGKESLNK